MSKNIFLADLQGRKLDLILRMYVDTADQDYISARSAYHSGLFHVFYWSAAQACEKYLKAFLLLQGLAVKKYGHQLTDLFDDAKIHDVNSILPDSLTIPETSAMGRDLWHGKELRLYVDYLEIYGSPDNRYSTLGTFVNGPVLHALDVLCFNLRRLIRNKNFTNEDLFVHSSRDLFCHDKIEEPQAWMIDPTLLLEMLFIRIYPVGANEGTRFAFSNMNMSFFQERDDEERSFGGQHFLGSPLYNHLVRLKDLKEANEMAPNNKDIVEQMRSWAEDNIFMTAKTKEKLGFPGKSKQPR